MVENGSLRGSTVRTVVAQMVEAFIKFIRIYRIVPDMEGKYVFNISRSDFDSALGEFKMSNWYRHILSEYGFTVKIRQYGVEVTCHRPLDL